MMFKSLNGAVVEMSPAEEAEIRAEWAANDAKLPAPVPAKTRVVDGIIGDPEQLAALKAALAK